jgi:hypothetical protein
MELRNLSTQEVVERYDRDGTSLSSVFPITVNSIRVIEVFRGDVSEGDIMEIIRLGGRAGNLELRMRNRMDIPTGIDVVLFIEPSGARVGTFQGIYHFPPPTNRAFGMLSDNQVLEPVSERDNLVVTVGDLRRIAETPITIELAQHEWQAPQSGGETRIGMEINPPFRRMVSASSSEQWLTVERRWQSIDIIAEANHTYADRTAIVTITAEESVETITVTQEAREHISAH